MKTFNYYYDYSPETFNYIMASRILRQSEKDLLKDMVVMEDMENMETMVKIMENTEDMVEEV